MDVESLEAASNRAADFFEGSLDQSGRLKDAEVSGDLAAVYKLPTLLLVTGRGRLAHKVLNDIKQRFMQPDGDFVSFPERTDDSRKTENAELLAYWPYMNAWVGMAAHRMGRFDISYPAYDFVKQFYNPAVGGWATSGRYETTPRASCVPVHWSGGPRYDVGIFMTSHCGLFALFMGDLERARSAGDLIVRMAREQPALDTHFFLHVEGETGKLVQNDGPAGLRMYYRFLKDGPDEKFYQLGYPVFFLHHLYQVCREDRYLDTAKNILDFCLTVNDGLYSSFLNHKVAFGSALIHRATGDERYRQLTSRCLQYLASLQTDQGDLLRDLGKQPGLDQSAEIPIWFRELANWLTELQSV